MRGLTKNRLETLAGIAAGYDVDGRSSSGAGPGSSEYNRIRHWLVSNDLVEERDDRLYLTGMGVREVGRALTLALGLSRDGDA